MRFRPCIDIHNGTVKQIVGGSLQDLGDQAKENFTSEKDAAFYADLYYDLGLTGGHVILLNPADSPNYAATKEQALHALSAHPGCLQVGGGITPTNAEAFLNAGASHVIVTSYVFSNGKINEVHLQELIHAVGKEHLVLDLSCKRVENKYFVVTDRWQKLTKTELNHETLDMLSCSCDEFLVHAADVEGKQTGIESSVAAMLGSWGKMPMTYAGGVHSFEDLRLLENLGRQKVDVTIGSALDIFGGTMPMKKVLDMLS